MLLLLLYGELLQLTKNKETMITDFQLKWFMIFILFFTLIVTSAIVANKYYTGRCWVMIQPPAMFMRVLINQCTGEIKEHHLIRSKQYFNELRLKQKKQQLESPNKITI